ncbi:amidase family protein [Mycoplasma sp. P36-A1]|uniref:amidase family protein n=1 Tax=Mycoplasma sp. P36-A1 TaxID=3252900 RepID=UPI003C2E4B40
MYKKTIKQLHNSLKNKEFTQEELLNSINNALISSKDLNCVNTLLNPEAKEYSYTNILDGIPYANKDLFATKNILTTSSSRILDNYYPMYNSTVFEKLEEANTVMVCKSNLDEFGMGGTNLNSIFGATKNPWNIEKGTGGSSGGSAGLVASGIVPFATGTDTGDSVRKPAAYCGIYGYKPTWGTVSRYGIFPYASSLDTPGIFARCIEDIAIVAETINGPDKKDGTSMMHTKENFYSNLKHPNKLKIGYIKELIETFDNPKVIEQFNEVKEYLESLGHEVVEVNMDLNLLKCIRGVYHSLANAEASSNLANLTGVIFGERIEKETWDKSIVATRNFGISKFSKARLCIGAMALKEKDRDLYYIKAKQIRTLLIKGHLELFKQVDILINPSANTAAFNPATDVIKQSELTNLVAENYLSVANIIGSPGLTIPTHIIDGMPFAISLMGRTFEDQLLFDLGKQFEDGLLDNNYKNVTSFYNRYAKKEND